MLNEGLGGFILLTFQSVPSDFSERQENSEPQDGREGDDLKFRG
jgi:hypothetical protein